MIEKRRLRRMSQHKWIGLNWMDGWKSPGGVKYRAAYAANNKWDE